jgi:hypothetical protein
VLASAYRDRELLPPNVPRQIENSWEHRFGVTPLQRMRSNGQAFKPARETHALPFCSAAAV